MKKREPVEKAKRWIKKICKGDVLRSPSGDLRVVRSVSHYGESVPKTNLALAIRRCSWTKRPYTVINGNDLRQMGYRPTRAKPRKLDGPLDRLIEEEIEVLSRDGGRRGPLRCCDVKGLP